MPDSNILFPELNKIVSLFDFEKITAERKKVIQPLIDFIQLKVNNNLEIRLNLICTHNSRRSHLSQVWAQTAAYYFDIKNVYCYSGGTEATALFPKVAETLRESGFAIKMLSQENNPVYSIKFAPTESPVIGFSKTYDDIFNHESSDLSLLFSLISKVLCWQVHFYQKHMFQTKYNFHNRDW